MASRVLKPDEVREILSELVKRLDARGEEAVIHVIGGAAIALMNPARVATEDVDGYIRLADASDVFAELERDYDLTSGWFNWRAQGLQPPVAGPDMWQEVYREGSVSLLAATRESLLAMKLNAGRTKDTNDIIWLLGELGITEYADAERIFEEHYPGDVLKPAAEQRLAYAIDQVNLRGGSSPDGLDRAAPRDPRELPKPLTATSGPTLTELLREARDEER